MVKHLPDILTLQRELVKKFQNITDLTCGTIAEFLDGQKAGTGTNWNKLPTPVVPNFLWNCVTHSLQEIKSSTQSLITSFSEMSY